MLLGLIVSTLDEIKPTETDSGKKECTKFQVKKTTT